MDENDVDRYPVKITIASRTTLAAVWNNSENRVIDRQTAC